MMLLLAIEISSSNDVIELAFLLMFLLIPSGSIVLEIYKDKKIYFSIDAKMEI